MSTRSRTLIVFALVFLGIVGNFLKIPVLFGVDFLFGSTFALVATAFFGPFTGALVAAAIWSIHLQSSSHPFFLLMGITESFVIGWLMQRFKSSVLIASAIFWVVLGPAMVWICYHSMMDVMPVATVMVWLKFSVNGIFNALLANLILVGINLSQFKNSKHPPLTFHQIFFTALVSLVLLPALTLMVVTSRAKMSSIEDELIAKTKGLSGTVDLVLTGWRKARVEAVSELSVAASERNLVSSADLQRDVRLIASSAAGFAGMIVTDLEGKVKASYVTGANDSGNIIGYSYSDRPFFETLRSGSELVISNVFLSRGLSQVPIIVFAKPVLSSEKAIGYAAGAADLTTLRNSLMRYSSTTGVTITILDQSGLVISSTNEKLRALDIKPENPKDLVTWNRDGAFHRLPEMKAMVPNMTRWEKAVYGSRIKATQLPWTILVESTLQPYSRELQRAYAEIFGLMLILCYAGLMIGFILTKWIGKSISSLAEVTSDVVSKVQDGDRFSWPWSPVKELSVLIANFKTMAEALQSRFLELQEEIAQRTSMQNQLVAATSVAQSANRAKSEFLANMSHEIRTPLGAVLGFTDLMANRDMTPSDRQECIQAIQRNGQQLYRLIDDVLDFSKIEVGHIKLDPTNTPLSEIVRGSLGNLERLAKEKGVNLKSRATTPLPSSLVVDSTRLKQILLNIAGNSVKFTDQGYIEVEFSLLPGPNVDQRVLMISVEDTGIGFSETEAAEKLFNVFGQINTATNRRYGGTGLGLVLSRRLAQAMGGDVKIAKASPGKGCKFEISVIVTVSANARYYSTLADACNDTQDIKPKEAPARPLDGLKLLVVEDAPDNRLLFKRALSRLGAQVEVAESGEDGVAMAMKHPYDVVLMDIQMPGLDGIQSTQLLRKQGYQGPIAALTAHALQEDRTRCLDAGFDEYLAKPVDWKKLVEVILSLKRAGPS